MTTLPLHIAPPPVTAESPHFCVVKKVSGSQWKEGLLLLPWDERIVSKQLRLTTPTTNSLMEVLVVLDLQWTLLSPPLPHLQTICSALRHTARGKMQGDREWWAEGKVYLLQNFDDSTLVI